MTDIINRASARLLVRNVVVPDAARRYRRALRDEGASDAEALARRVGAETLAAHRDSFPALYREDAARLVDTYCELCAEAFAEEYARHMRPRDDAEEFEN